MPNQKTRANKRKKYYNGTKDSTKYDTNYSSKDSNNYIIPYYFNKDKLFYYTKENLKLDINYDLGYPINIPNKAEEVLERQYGKDWMIENKNFSY